MTTVTIEAQCECAERLLSLLDADLSIARDSGAKETTARIRQDIAELRAIHTTLKWLAADREGCARLLSSRYTGGQDNG